jgi:hypothetical protein
MQTWQSILHTVALLLMSINVSKFIVGDVYDQNKYFIISKIYLILQMHLSTNNILLKSTVMRVNSSKTHSTYKFFRRLTFTDSPSHGQDFFQMDTSTM